MSLRAGLVLLVLLIGPAAPARAGSQWICADNAQISVGQFVLFNNVWNKGTTRGYEQCVAGSEGAFRWKWRWPGGDLMPEAYPEIVYGHQPWRTVSTTKALPRRISKLTSLTAEYEARLEGQGRFNLTFQLWLVDRIPPAPDHARVELMVWVANRGMTPAGSPSGLVTQGGVTYTAYSARRRHLDEGVERSWDLVTLVAGREALTGPLDLGGLLRELSEGGRISNELWVANVDFGTELVSGSGSAEILNYDIDVK